MVSAVSGSDQERRGGGTWDWNLESDRVSYSPRWVAMLGLRMKNVTHRPDDWLSRVHSEDLGPLLTALRQHWRGETEAFEMKYRVRCSDDAYRWMRSCGVASRDAKGKAVRMVGTQTDVTDLTVLDRLTGLFNQASLTERLTTALENKHQKGRDVAVLVLGVDRFVLLNDSLGTEAGDHLLVEFADRIRVVLEKWRSRSEDRKSSVCARLDGDKFAIVLEGVSSPLQAVSVADEVLKAVRKDIIFSRKVLRFTASLGLVLSDSITTAIQRPPEELLRNATAAMDSAKTQGGGAWVLFSESMPDGRSHRSKELDD